MSRRADVFRATDPDVPVSWMLMGPSADHPSKFWHSLPGQRFQNRYWRHRHPDNRRTMFVRVASLALGVALAVPGVLMLVLPGPGLLVLALAGALFASESLRIARALDWIELRFQAIWHAARRRWARSGN